MTQRLRPRLSTLQLKTFRLRAGIVLWSSRLVSVHPWKTAGGSLVPVSRSGSEGSNASSGEDGHDSDTSGEPDGRSWSDG